MHPDDTHCPGCESGDCPGLASRPVPAPEPSARLREALAEVRKSVTFVSRGHNHGSLTTDEVAALLELALAATPQDPEPLCDCGHGSPHYARPYRLAATPQDAEA